MKHKLAPIALTLAVILSVTALAQSGTAAAPAAAHAATPAASTPAAAAPSGSTGIAKIGIISLQQAVFATNEGRRDFETLQKKFQPKQTELEASNKEIEDLKKQLNTQGDKLNEEARANLVKQIETKQKSFQRNLEDFQGDAQAQQNEIGNRILQKLADVLDKYAKDNGFSLILDVSGPQSPVVWAGSSTDVTKAVVDAYNAQSGVPAPAAGTAAPKPTGAATTPKPATPKPATPAPSTTPH